jgi:hypothetical protein
MSVFRIINRDGDPVNAADSLDAIAEIIRHARPGRYQVEEGAGGSFPTVLKFHRWGSVTNLGLGRVELAPDLRLD